MAMTKERFEEIKASIALDDWASGNEAQELIAEVERLQKFEPKGLTADHCQECGVVTMDMESEHRPLCSKFRPRQE